MPVSAVQVQGLDGDEGLPLAGLHLGDVPFVEHDPAHQLDVEEAYPHRALEGLADGGVRLEENVFRRLAVLDPLAELGRLGRKLLVGKGFELRLERRDVLGLFLELLQPSAFTDA